MYQGNDEEVINSNAHWFRLLCLLIDMITSEQCSYHGLVQSEQPFLFSIGSIMLVLNSYDICAGNSFFGMVFCLG